MRTIAMLAVVASLFAASVAEASHRSNVRLVRVRSNSHCDDDVQVRAVRVRNFRSRNDRVFVEDSGRRRNFQFGLINIGR